MNIFGMFSDVQYYLLPERTYVVGRKDCEILLKNDPAISRKHATFTVSPATPSSGNVSIS